MIVEPETNTRIVFVSCHILSIFLDTCTLCPNYNWNAIKGNACNSRGSFLEAEIVGRGALVLKFRPMSEGIWLHSLLMSFMNQYFSSRNICRITVPSVSRKSWQSAVNRATELSLSVYVAATLKSGELTVLCLMSQGFPDIVQLSNRKTISLLKGYLSKTVWSPHLFPLFLNSKKRKKNPK